MMAPTNPTPLVVFALIAMVICGMLGVMLGLDPFGPGQEVRAEQARTQHAVDIYGTEMARNALATPQALIVQQTLVPAELTAMPMQQMATQAAGQAAIAAAQVQATQTAIAGEMIHRQLAAQATQTVMAWDQEQEALSAASTATAIARDQSREQASGLTLLAVIVIAALVLSGWIIARTRVQIAQARAQEKLAQAEFLAEQRRMLSLRASLHKHNGHKAHDQVPNSLMNKTGNIDKLTKAD
ncbi:MAG TPA: hypothetical protein VI524_05865 [Anaerolineales bacterium]|nr:hypothetical protein [Anaerolineales bacterium]